MDTQEQIGKYSVGKAISLIEEQGGKVAGGTITASKLGIGAWGAVDYLVKTAKYRLVKED